MSVKRSGGCFHLLQIEDAGKVRRWWLKKVGRWRHRKCREER